MMRNPLRRNSEGRYERFIPVEVRQLAEKRGIPKPNRYVPSAQGATAATPIAQSTNGSGPESHLEFGEAAGRTPDERTPTA
jgi:hypothetical protein